MFIVVSVCLIIYLTRKKDQKALHPWSTLKCRDIDCGWCPFNNQLNGNLFQECF